MTATKIVEWEDAPEPGRTADDWPYPTTHKKFLIGGDLAARVCKRLGADEGTPVFITEKVESGGYSEFTQEDETKFIVECGVHTMWFDEYRPRVDWGTSLVGRLDIWLREVE